jgi:hypothetical protein
MRTQLMPQTTVGKLVSLHADGRGSEYTHSSEIPALMPLSLGVSETTNTTIGSDDSGEKTMLWMNIASLFSKTDQHDTDIQKWGDSLTRSTNDILQELQDIKTELAEVRNKQLLTSQVRKIKKYVNKKCEKMREDINYGSFDADNEIFAYINKMRAEMDQRMKKLEMENAALREELTALHNTYDNDYNTFVERENDLMSQMNAAVKLAEEVSDRVKDCEFTFARRLDEERNATAQTQHTMAGDLREEFVCSITKENEMERKTQLNWLQGVHDELVDLVTRSNEYHSHRYFGLVEQVNKTHDTCQDMCQTLKNSIRMVDAELSDTKEKVEFLTEEVAQANNDIYDAKESVSNTKDEIYREMDRDYYDLKDYIKRKIRTVIKQQQQQQQQQQQEQDNKSLFTNTQVNLVSNVIEALKDPIQIIAEEYKENQPEPQHENDHIIIMDESMFVSDSDQDE